MLSLQVLSVPKFLTPHMHRFLLLYSFIMLALNISAQELSCQLEVNTSGIQGTNKEIFTRLENSMTEYLNSTGFTKTRIAPGERINCRMMLTVNEYADDHVKGELQIQSSRPVYNSSYTTTVLNFRDTDIDFEYREGDPLTFNENDIESNLTALLDFYAYLILALDFDTFSPNGGDEFYDRARDIAARARSVGYTGWGAYESRRCALLDALTDPATGKIHEFLYDYHRQGLDLMSISPEKGRAKITETLSMIVTLYESSPMSAVLPMIKDAKLGELAGIYSKALPEEKKIVTQILAKVYPAEQETINTIKSST